MKRNVTLTLVCAAVCGVVLGGLFSGPGHVAVAQPAKSGEAKPAEPLKSGEPPVGMGGQGGMLATRDIGEDLAHRVLMAAVEQARQINTKMDIAIVDAGGNLKAFLRMDGAWLGSIDISIKKARTARYFDMPTGEIGKLSQPGGPLYNIEVSNSGLITFPGGLPLKLADGTIIGAIGVSGSTVENDHTVAQAGAALVK